MLPTCPKANCTSTTFAVRPLTAAYSDYELQAVCCSRCGAVLGVLDTTITTEMLHQVLRRLSQAGLR